VRLKHLEADPVQFKAVAITETLLELGLLFGIQALTEKQLTETASMLFVSAAKHTFRKT
jgi:hypothetical protein